MNSLGKQSDTKKTTDSMSLASHRILELFHEDHEGQVTVESVFSEVFSHEQITWIYGFTWQNCLPGRGVVEFLGFSLETLHFPKSKDVFGFLVGFCFCRLGRKVSVMRFGILSVRQDCGH